MHYKKHCSIVYPLAITGNTIKIEYPVLALVTLLCVVIARDGQISRLDARLFLALYVGFTAFLVRLVRGQTLACGQIDCPQSIGA